MVYFKKVWLLIFCLYSVLLLSFSSCKAQVQIDSAEVERTLKVLSSDSMQGRKVFTPGIKKAADFIINEFKEIGLTHFPGAIGFEDTLSIRLGSDSLAKKEVTSNIIGVLPGRSKKDQYVIFSAHYDHIGIQSPVNGDSIANGADDDASGVAAVIALARHYKKVNNNEVTLVFIAFTAEEIGGFGSKSFINEIDPKKVVAMVNIEMIGKESKFGPNAAFITGYERSDLGKILQKNLEGTRFTLHPDPYPEQDLFYRSDNASLAKHGVPAHTVSTDQIDKDIYYHTVDDEFSTLSIQNLVNTIEAIVQGSKSIVAGKDIPSRIK
ncbi:MAG TPA: M20/M25/M40 family metallo-hydrolase [Cytophagales bacterium]|nr:M20/M25/M40 family metallo-hydrolase [Cytophagales bacterium]